jgi:glyoxylase-like metal-dependent hydrolase (beta-lactamase superfamily II)
MAQPEKIAPGVYRIDALGLKYVVNVLLLENDDGYTLVDTGVAGSVGRIRDAIGALGAGPEDLRRVFITHQHDDHTGGLEGILEWAPHAEVGATEHEAEVIEGRRPFDPPNNAFLRYMMRNAKGPGVRVRKVLREGDLVSGFRLIATPGHTRGHVSMLRDADGLLFTADAFGHLPGVGLRVGVLKPLCNDPPLAKRSAEKLLNEDFATVVPAHGPVIRAGARAALHDAVERCRY